jgi:ferritin-like protein
MQPVGLVFARTLEGGRMSSEVLHEDANKLGPEVIDQHRAIVSLMEELEAVDWYNQRAKATSNPDLRAILEHNRDEEKEHASMVLEWLRRSDPKLMQHLKTFLFTEGPITEIEAEMVQAGASGKSGDGMSSDGSLGIGSLRVAKEQVSK